MSEKLTRDLVSERGRSARLYEEFKNARKRIAALESVLDSLLNSLDSSSDSGTWLRPESLAAEIREDLEALND